MRLKEAGSNRAASIRTTSGDDVVTGIRLLLQRPLEARDAVNSWTHVALIVESVLVKKSNLVLWVYLSHLRLLQIL